MNPVERARNFYDRFAENYDSSRYSSPEQRRRARNSNLVFGKFAGSVKGKAVLDCGCGTGRLSSFFYGRGASVTGMDTSKNMLSIARRKVPSATFVEGSVLDIPFKDGSFDVVVSSQVLTHLHMYERPLKEFSRVLKDDGVIVIDVRNLLNPMNLLAMILYRLKGSDYQPHYTTIFSMRSVCRKLGLRIVQWHGLKTNVQRGWTKHFSPTLILRMVKIQNQKARSKR